MWLRCVGNVGERCRKHALKKHGYVPMVTGILTHATSCFSRAENRGEMLDFRTARKRKGHTCTRKATGAADSRSDEEA